MAVIHQPATDTAGRIRYPAACLFALSVAYWITRSARDALFLAGDGIFLLPWAYGLIAAGGFPLLALAVFTVRRMGLRRARVTAAFVTAGVQCAAAVAPLPAYPALRALGFAATPLAYGMLLTLFWLLLAELRSQSETNEVRTQVYGAGAVLAGIACGGAIARWLAPVADPPVLLLIGAIALVAAAGVVVRAYKRFPAAEWATPVRPLAPPSLRQTARALTEKAVRFRFAIGLVTVSLAVLVEFQFYVDAAIAARPLRVAAAYHGTVTLAIGVLALVVFVITRFVERFGVRAASAHPLALLAAAAMRPLTGVALPPSALRVVDTGVARATTSAHVGTAEVSGLAAEFFVAGWGRGMALMGAAATLGIWLQLSAQPGRLAEADLTWVGPLILGGALLLLGLRLIGDGSRANAARTLNDLPEDASALAGSCLAAAVPALAEHPDVPGAVQLGERTVIPDPPR